MKKIRYIPFGYQIIKGKIAENSDEKALVEEIYQKYLQGWSIKRLALYAERSGIPYRENSGCWNKNMVTRILEDERYWNHKQYPPIISKELADKVIELKKSKVTPRSSVQFAQRKMVCSICGNTLIRNSQRKPRIFWNCKGCQKSFGPLPDNDLLQAITEKLLKICQNPQMVEPEQDAADSLSLQAARLTNEINQLLNQREMDKDKVLSLILECAAEKYKTCSIKKSDHLTIKIKALFQEHGSDEGLDQELFEQTVKQVILQPDGSVQFRLLNEKIV
ncbi:recombinase family protein [[Clostridium] leptum]|nr:recombinase family protein [[Clostridium] leptum]